MVPTLDQVLAVETDATGHLTLAGLWPAGVPPGVRVFFQAWVHDPAGPAGAAGSNGLMGTAQ
jgi:hypothetical protein